MSTGLVTKETIGRLKTWLIVSGIVALLAGIAMTIWPVAAITAVTFLVATYALLTGVVYLVIAFTGKELSIASRIGHGLAGALFIAAAVVAFLNPVTSAGLFTWIVTTMLAISWIFEGIAALTNLNQAPARGWAIFYAIISILGGIALLLSPMFGGLLITIWIGITLIVMGVVAIIRGIMLGKK